MNGVVLPRRPGALRAVLLACALFLGAAPARADLYTTPATPAQVQALIPASATALTRAAVLRGSFVQTKTLADLPKPLTSRGDFLFAKERGVIWRVTKPFASEFVLTPQAVLTREGGRERRLDASEQPGLAVATKLFTALFTLDTAALAQDFVLYAEGSAAAWRLGLVPRHAAMAKVFARATVEGGAQVQRVGLADARGDLTTIALADLVPADRLDAADAARFPSLAGAARGANARRP